MNNIMSRFIVFDVETPNRYNNRMSAIGIAVVEDGVIVNEYYSLVDPEQPFDYFNTRIRKSARLWSLVCVIVMR